jgi:hypothetical protein
MCIRDSCISTHVVPIDMGVNDVFDLLLGDVTHRCLNMVNRIKTCVHKQYAIWPGEHHHVHIIVYKNSIKSVLDWRSHTSWHRLSALSPG